MPKRLTKNEIIRETNKIRSELRYTKLNPLQKKFLHKFVSRNKGKIILLLLLCAVEVLLSLSLPLLSHFYLQKYFALLNYGTFILLGGLIFILIAVYLLNSYFEIYFNVNIALRLINKVRETWYRYYLKHSAAFHRKFDGKKLLTKMVYHTQLLFMGMESVVYGSFQAVLLYIGILIFTFIFNTQLFIVLWLALPVVVIIFILTDFIGRYYITREQTFNSRIVSHLSDSLLNFNVIKAQNRETSKIKEFSNLIDIDTYFRTRRNIWVQYSNRVLYAAILLFGVLLYFVQIYLPFIKFDSVNSVASTGFILGFFVRILFLVSRVGIFFQAFKLGMQLCSPSFSMKRIEAPVTPNWDKIVFKSQKTKFSNIGKFIKDFNFEIEKGGRYLIYSSGMYGKSTLARMISGNKEIESITLRIDSSFVKSKKWTYMNGDRYLVEPINSVDITIGEVLFAKPNIQIGQEDINEAYGKLARYKFFEFLFQNTNLFGKRITQINLSDTEAALLQIAYLILHPKMLIVIDHSCLNKGVSEALKLLESSNPKATIVVFDSSKNSILKYNKIYELGEGFFKEV